MYIDVLRKNRCKMVASASWSQVSDQKSVISDFFAKQRQNKININQNKCFKRKVREVGSSIWQDQVRNNSQAKKQSNFFTREKVAKQLAKQFAKQFVTKLAKLFAKKFAKQFVKRFAKQFAMQFAK